MVSSRYTAKCWSTIPLIITLRSYYRIHRTLFLVETNWVHSIITVVVLSMLGNNKNNTQYYIILVLHRKLRL